MRRLTAWMLAVAAVCHANSVFAADYAPIFKAPPPVLPTWAGFYIGGHVGGGRGDETFVDNFPTFDGEIDARPRLVGLLGGLQLGFNAQFNRLVLGIDAGFSWAAIRNRDFPCFFFGDQVCSAETQWFSTVTGRIGGAFGHTLLYAKGGVAWARDKYSDLATCGGTQPVVRNGIFADCGDTYFGHQTRPGWVAGIGIEYLIARNWSLMAEFNHMQFRKKSVLLTDADGDFFTEEIHQRLNVFKIGFNYYFRPDSSAMAARAQAISGHGPGETDEPSSTVTVFSGVDAARQSVAGWLGAIIALSRDLDTSGGRVMILGGGGRYRYSTDGVPIQGIHSFADVLAGYAFEGDNYSINLLAGGSVANHQLSPFDQDNIVQGTEAGAKTRVSLYANPTPQWLVYAETEYTTVFRTFAAEAKVGYNAWGSGIFIGPEGSYFQNVRSNEWRAGMHLSEIKVGRVSLDLSGGYSRDSIVGGGPYGRLGLSRSY